MRYDVVVIGSGFGGSVAALRLVEKGYSVAVLEAGRRFADHEFPETSWRLRRFLWAPALGCYGIQRIDAAAPGRGEGRRGRAGALRRRRRRRQPGLRQHALRAAGRVLRRSTVARHHRLAGRAGAALRPGQADARGHDLHPRDPGRPRHAHGRRADGRRRHLPRRPRSACILGEPGRTVPDPYFGGAGPGPHRLPALWQAA